MAPIQGRAVALPTQNVGAGLAPLPAPTLATDGAAISSAGVRPASIADILVVRTGPTAFTMPGPVYLFAYMTPQGSEIASAAWVKTETLELTGMDLNFDGTGYRLHVSPWWTRLVLVAPNWLFAAGQTIRTAYRPYVE